MQIFAGRFQNLKAGLSKKYYRKILFVNSKTSTTKVIYSEVHPQKILKSFGSNISCLISSGNSYIHACILWQFHSTIIFLHSKISVLHPVAEFFCSNGIFIQQLVFDPIFVNSFNNLGYCLILAYFIQ